jgi:Fe-S-cluster containining protein
MLTRKDIERIEENGYRVKDFLEPTNSELKSMPFTRGTLKNREDGACIFLKFDAKQNRYECSIYDFRPILCRFYPFDFDMVGPDSIVLKYIPCCRGLNNLDGELVDENFITKNLRAALLERLATE